MLSHKAIENAFKLPDFDWREAGIETKDSKGQPCPSYNYPGDCLRKNPFPKDKSKGKSKAGKGVRKKK